MQRIHITLEDKEADILERRSKENGVSKSKYIKLLISLSEEQVNMKEINMPLTNAINNLDIEIKQLLLKNEFAEYEKLKLFEELKLIKNAAMKL